MGTHQSARTHCPTGHAYDELNTWVDKRGFRYCRTCINDRKRASRPPRDSRSKWARHLVVQPGASVVLVPVGPDACVIDAADLPLVSPYAWRLNAAGYALASRKDRRSILMHRLLLDVTDPELTVDHINRDPLDNRRSNLRLATRSQQGANTRLLRSSNTSGFRGVSRNRRGDLWVAHIREHGKSRSLGSFVDPAAAAHAYDQAAAKAFGEFAVLNFGVVKP